MKKVLIIQKELPANYYKHETYENEECWLVNEDFDGNQAIKDWKKLKKEFPKLYQYLESLNCELIGFEEIIV